MKAIWKVLGAALGIFILINVAGGIGKWAGKPARENARDSTINSSLMNAASELNKKAPMMVDTGTRLDSAIGMNKQLKYNYTAINTLAEDIDVAQFNSTMQTTITNKVCTSKEMEMFMKNGVSVTYAYNDKNGKQLAVITVEQSQCQNK
jgi:hypothetical protein